MKMKKIEQNIKKLDDEEIALLEASPEHTSEAYVSTLKTLLSTKTIIIISMSKPSTSLFKIWKKNGIDSNKMFILDAVSQTASSSAGNVINTDGPTALTKLSLALDAALKLIKAKKIVLIDSIPSMLIYNSPNVVVHFIHNLLTKIRLQEIGCVILSSTKGVPEDVRAEITQLSDLVIRA